MANNTSLGAYPNFIYKAYGKQGATALIPAELSGKIKSVTYVTAQGELPTQYMQGNVQETNAIKFNLGKAPEQLGPGQIKVTLEDGTVLTQDIQNPNMDFRQGKETAPQNPNSGPNGAYAGPYGATSVGVGAIPAYLGGEYPTKVAKAKFSPINSSSIDYSPITYDPTQTASYDFTDPQAFAKSFGGFNRSEIKQNYALAKELALDQLDTELQGLQTFAPAAAALKRSQTSLDNIFNQQERQAQVNSALPNAAGDLAAQRERALAYSRGEVPNSVTDRALELGVRSQAADVASAGGFGARSSVSRKISDLMSADERLKLASYGESLLTGNLNSAVSLLLAPTEYSNAGNQIQVTPQTNAGIQAGANLNQINADTLINPTTALNSQVQQRQFGTQLQQQTNQFNASNQLNTSQFNANNQLNTSQFNANLKNNVAQFNSQGKFNASQLNTGRVNDLRMGKFNYDVSYAGAVAGAYQLNTNTQLALAQQAQSASIFQDNLTAAQGAAQTGAITQGLAALLPQLTSLLTAVKSLSSTGTVAAPTTQPPANKPGASSGTGGSGTTSYPNSNTYPDNSIYPGIQDGVIHGGPDGSAWVAPGDEIPAGFIPVASSDGGTIIIPDESINYEMQSFQNSLMSN